MSDAYATRPARTPMERIESVLIISTLLLLVVMWSLLGMTVAQTPWLASSGLLQAIFYVVAGILFILGALAGFLASRAFKKGTPPMPAMAIDEAKRIRETVRSEHPETTV